MQKNLKELGRKFSESRNIEVFNEIYKDSRIGVLNFYSYHGYDRSEVDCAFNDAMYQIWKDIDKLDFHAYSISTMINLKTKQNLIKYKDKAFKTVGYGGAMFDDNYECSNMGEGAYYQSQNVHNQMTLQRAEQSINHWLGQIDKCYETKLINQEKIDELINQVLEIKYGNIILDHYYNELSYKDLEKKYSMSLDSIRNKMFAGRKNCRKVLTGNKRIWK